MDKNIEKLIEEMVAQEKKTLDLIAEEIKKLDSCIDAIPQSYYKSLWKTDGHRMMIDKTENISLELTLLNEFARMSNEPWND